MLDYYMLRWSRVNNKFWQRENVLMLGSGYKKGGGGGFHGHMGEPW